MKVILNKDVPNIGEEGEIKDVARGYARNYLIPQKLVMPYSAQGLAILASRRESIEQRRSEKSKAALDIKQRLEGEPLMIEMPAGERGRLFGSVTSANIVDALAAQGINVERKRIEIPEKTIKSVGVTRVKIRLYGDEEAELRVEVRAAGGEAAAEAAQAAAAEEAAAAAAAAPEAVAEATDSEPDAVAAEEETPIESEKVDE